MPRSLSVALDFAARGQLFSHLAAMEKAGVPVAQALLSVALPGHAKAALQGLQVQVASGRDMASAGLRSGLLTPLDSSWLGAAQAASRDAGLPDEAEDARSLDATGDAQGDAQPAPTGGGVPTVEFCNRLGQQPLSFQPGTHWRYSTCADILGAVVEVVSGMRFGEFLRKEFFEPLDMVDTGFYVPESKRNRLVTVYKRTESGLVPWTSTHLAVGVYDREPAFESGGAGLVSTLEDYSHFADMLLAGGTYEGRRILSPATVACMTQPQLKDAVRRDMWDSLDGYSYGHLMRICAEPGRIAGLACAGEYGWDGWLGTYFANFPGQQMTILSMQNTVDSGTTRVVRQMRNAVLASLSREN